MFLNAYIGARQHSYPVKRKGGVIHINIITEILFRGIIYKVVAVGKLGIDLIPSIRELKYIRNSFLKALEVIVNQPVLFKAFLTQYTNKD
jgi:hypothetical protein